MLGSVEPQLLTAVPSPVVDRMRVAVLPRCLSAQVVEAATLTVRDGLSDHGGVFIGHFLKERELEL